jgi:hypothetical protein
VKNNMVLILSEKIICNFVTEKKTLELNKTEKTEKKT